MHYTYTNHDIIAKLLKLLNYNNPGKDKIISAYSVNVKFPEYIREALIKLNTDSKFDFSKYFNEKYDKNLVSDQALLEFLITTFNKLKI